MWEVFHRRRLSSGQIIPSGFALVILVGALVLMLPVSSNRGTVTSFLDGLFTSTSAVCVTGLIVYDTTTSVILRTGMAFTAMMAIRLFR